MAPGIEELDLMVQSFYDARGEQVRHVAFLQPFFLPAWEDPQLCRARATNAVLFPASAKSCPNRLEPG